MKMKTVTYHLNLLLFFILHYKVTSGQDVCDRLNISYFNHPTPYVFVNSVIAHLRCELPGVPRASLNWWRSKDPCGPFTNATSVGCFGGSSSCEFNVGENEGYLYFCCTGGVSAPDSPGRDRLYCLQVSICPLMSASVTTIPPVAFYGETLLFYLALDISPEVELVSMVTIGNFSNSTRGRVVPSDMARPRLLYEFSMPLPLLDMGGVLSKVHMVGATHCNTDLNLLRILYVTSRGPITQPPSSMTSLTIASSDPPMNMTTADGSVSPVSTSTAAWRLGAIVLICVVAVLFLLFVIATIFYCYKIATLNKAKSDATCNGERPPVHYNPLSAVSREDTTPSDQAISPLAAAPQSHAPNHALNHQDQGETSPPAYMDLTPVKSLANLVPHTPSPTTIDTRTVMTRGVNHHSLQHAQQQQQQQKQQEPLPASTTPTGSGNPRPPPMHLAIRGRTSQQSHTGETPLIGLDTPSNADGAGPFAQQFPGSIEVTDHVYAQPELPLAARPPLQSTSHSEAGSNASGSNTVFSGASGRSLGLEDIPNGHNGPAIVGGNAGHELYSMQRINRDADEVILSNDRSYESENTVNI